jgi:hypothetical protein
MRWLMDNNFVFMNKFKIDNKKVMNSIVIKLLMVLILIVLVLKNLLDGISFTSVFIPVFLLTLFLPKGAPTFEIYASTRVSFEEKRMRITYMNLDRKDKLGSRTEDYLIYYDTLKKVRYNEKYYKLEIISKADVTITSSKNETMKKDYRTTDEWSQNMLYLPDEIREQFLASVQEVCKAFFDREND